jgi:hypothetical protein
LHGELITSWEINSDVECDAKSSGGKPPFQTCEVVSVESFKAATSQVRKRGTAPAVLLSHPHFILFATDSDLFPMV